MITGYKFIAASCAYLIIITGCLTLTKNDAVLDIPFHPQTATNQCGAVALTMVLDYYGTDYNITNIVEETYIPLLNGSSFSLLQEAANKYGLQTQPTDLTIDEIKDIVNSNKTAIIYLAPLHNTNIGHFAVVTGVSENNKKIRIHGIKKADIWIRTHKLLKRSNKSRFPALIISN